MRVERRERGFWLADQLLTRWLILLTALGVAGYMALEWLAGPSDAVSELRVANPGWTIEKPRHMGLRLADGSGGPALFINGDDAGPLRLSRLDCVPLLAALPAWARRLPPGRSTGCLQLGDAAVPVRVLNHHTAMPVGELWTRHYEPHLEELQLPYWGGSIGSDGAASGAAERRRHALSYSVDPASGSADPRVHLMAFYLGDETVLVITLRAPGAP